MLLIIIIIILFIISGQRKKAKLANDSASVKTTSDLDADSNSTDMLDPDNEPVVKSEEGLDVKDADIPCKEDPEQSEVRDPVDSAVIVKSEVKDIEECIVKNENSGDEPSTTG